MLKLVIFLINFLLKPQNQLQCFGDIGDSSSELIGASVFKSDRLIGELSAKETLCYNLIQNDVDSFNISIPNPENEKESIDLYLYTKSKPKINVKLINGSPYISVKLKLEAKILSLDENSNYITELRLNDISNSANQYITNLISDYLYKTSKEYESDINQFGKYTLKLFSTTNDFENYNWLENYKNSFFDVNIDTNVQSALLLSGK